MQYFRLIDDLNIPMRWHLGELTSESGGPVDLDLGTRVDVVRLTCPVTAGVEPLDFTLSSFNAPIVRAQLGALMCALAPADLQRVPLTISGYEPFEAINVLKLIDCLDEETSTFGTWTKFDHRPDLAGQYRSVTGLTVDARRVPSHVHAFRVHGWSVALIVSAEMRRVMEGAGCQGAVFLEVN